MTSILILNVDDHEPGRYARSRLLTMAGYEVAEATNGKEALRLIEQLRPALVMLDVNMPEMDGLEVCRRIRGNIELAGTPVLQISASAVSVPQQAKGLDSGADVYLVEPVAAEVLMATVRALLRMRNAEAELQRVNKELHRANGDLQKLNASLKFKNEDVFRFAYNASHDLQEPLRTIRCFAELVGSHLGSALDSEAKRYLTHIDNASARMNALITDLLTYAEAGEKVGSVVEPVNIDCVLSAALANLEQSLQECGGNVSIGPMPVVQGDEGLLIRLFQNLISNAIKYRSPTEVLAIEIRADEAPESNWRFSIKDNGEGIPAPYLESIFQPFKRLHGRQIPGTGIGLATCCRIVEGHGGRLWAHSDGPDTGSTFFFTLAA